MAEVKGVDICILLDSYASERPDSPAMTVDDQTISYGGLRRLSLKAASHLNSLGVKQDTMVALPMHNSFEQTAFMFGAWRLGATPLTLSPDAPAAEIQKILEVAETDVVVREGRDLESEPLWEGPYRIASRCKALTSGGSTGVPKVIIDTAPSIVDVTENSALGWNSGPAMFVPGPTFHSSPQGHMVEALARGLHFVTMRKFDAARSLELISRHRPHYVLIVPTMMNRIVKLPRELIERADFSSIKYLWHLGAACPPWLKQEWIDLVGADKVWEIYAGSEGAAATVINGTEWLEHRGSVGRPYTGEIAIFDENGNPVPNGQIGEIYMRNLAGERRYQLSKNLGRRIVRDWESLGDLGWLDDEGFLFLADRRVDMIITGGQNVYPAEVEAAIQSYPGVGDAVVFGQPDDDLGEMVCAIVWAPERTFGKQDLLDHLANEVVRYKIPRRLAFSDEPIRNDAGKVRRSDLTIAD
jgi:bile acid-coenzyme A ligase